MVSGFKKNDCVKFNLIGDRSKFYFGKIHKGYLHEDFGYVYVVRRHDPAEDYPIFETVSEFDVYQDDTHKIEQCLTELVDLV